VYYEDTDAGGVVFYANYLCFYERARTEMLRALGFQQDQLRASHGILFAVKSAQVDYLLPARFNDELTVTAEICNLRRASLEFTQRVIRTIDQKPLSRATIKVVCLNEESFRPVPIPPEIVNKLCQ